MRKLIEIWLALCRGVRALLSRRPTGPPQGDDFDNYFALRAKGAEREAYAVLRDIMESNPDWSQVGDLYVWCADFEMLLRNDVCKAQQLLEKAWELGCDHPVSFYSERGFVRWCQGKHEEGIEDLERSIALEPSVTHLIRLGELLAIEGDGRAHGILQRVLEGEPRHCLAHIYLGLLAGKSGDRDKAISLAQRAEELAESATDFEELGRLYRELREFRAAVGAYLKADELGYESKGRLHASLADCYAWLGEKETGRTYLQQALKYDPDDHYIKSIAENDYPGR